MYKKIYSNIRLLTLFTLIITSSLLITACFVMYSSVYKEEMKNETKLIKEYLDKNGDIKGIEYALGEKRVTIITESGIVLYDSSIDDYKNLENHSQRPEVLQALNNEIGYAERYSDTLHKMVYYCALRLENGNVVRISGFTGGIYKMFAILCIPIIIIVIFLYFIIASFAKNLTKSIIQPINSIDISKDKYDSEYDELMPFLNKIRKQSGEIKEQLEKIKNQKIRLSTISDNMNEGLIVVDKNKKIISINESAENIFKKNDTKNNSVYYLTREENIIKQLEKAFGGEKLSFETRINENSYQAFMSPVFEGGKTTSVIILLFDIDEKVKAEKVRREFSANVSHELKTPLTTILGYSQIINTGMAKGDDVKNFSAKIEKEATGLIALINDIIELSRLDETSEASSAETVSISDIIKEASEKLKKSADERNISINFSGAGFCVNGNRTQLFEMVYNLIDNAVKYNKENGYVNITAENNSITVSDSGIGISKDNIERIFERFYRVDKSRSKKVNGTGLGLSIVKHIAKCHNAEISVESTLGEGTTFTVKFTNKNI